MKMISDVTCCCDCLFLIKSCRANSAGAARASNFLFLLCPAWEYLLTACLLRGRLENLCLVFSTFPAISDTTGEGSRHRGLPLASSIWNNFDALLNWNIFQILLDFQGWACPPESTLFVVRSKVLIRICYHRLYFVLMLWVARGETWPCHLSWRPSPHTQHSRPGTGPPPPPPHSHWSGPSQPRVSPAGPRCPAAPCPRCWTWPAPPLKPGRWGVINCIPRHQGGEWSRAGTVRGWGWSSACEGGWWQGWGVSCDCLVLTLMRAACTAAPPVNYQTCQHCCCC